MKDNKLPIILIIVSIILITFDFIDSSGAIDKSFWKRTISGFLVILAMVFTIKNNKNETRK